MLKSPLCEELRASLAELTPEELTASGKKFAVDPLLVERVTVVFPDAQTLMKPDPEYRPTAMSALVVVGLSKPFERAKVANGIFERVRPKVYHGRTYFFDENTWRGVLLLPDDRVFVVGAEDSLVWLIDRLEKGDLPGSLAPVRAECTKHAVYAAANLSSLKQELASLPQQFRPLTQARRATVAIDLNASIEGSLEFHYPDEAGADAGATALKTAIAMLREQVQSRGDRFRKQTEEAGQSRQLKFDEFPPHFVDVCWVGISRRVDKALQSLAVERRDTNVRIVTTLPKANTLVMGIVGITALGSNTSSAFKAVGPAIRPGEKAPAVAPEEIRLKKLGRAFDAYHAEHGHYPPAAVLGKDGTPLFSWRVALLPYLGEKELYSQFRLNEPWDSLHNKKFIEKMPAGLNMPFIYPKNYGKTNVKIVSGSGTLFDGPDAAKKPSDGSMLLALESGDDEPVWWTKPADLKYITDQAPDVFGRNPHGTCWVLLTDGSVKPLNQKTFPKLLVRPEKK
ncbi:hypothetical protein FRUB_03419 [Fimbriiglobus ruber]|uniref:DUF1559 domain-containing protein n=1 Tax=Fimbriiglobus ruber TaxID=1908690 RepID=A0A225DQS3_9BACT|nr:hypothetical protein FRUB_03419 [Fimbriiglobus ruber]